jgi:hypothetical protein
MKSFAQLASCLSVGILALPLVSSNVYAGQRLVNTCENEYKSSYNPATGRVERRTELVCKPRFRFTDTQYKCQRNAFYGQYGMEFGQDCVPVPNTSPNPGTDSSNTAPVRRNVNILLNEQGNIGATSSSTHSFYGLAGQNITLWVVSDGFTPGATLTQQNSLIGLAVPAPTNSHWSQLELRLPYSGLYSISVGNHKSFPVTDYRYSISVLTWTQ